MRRSICLFLLPLFFVSVQTAYAEAVLIAGSSGQSPPPFLEDSFWGITTSIDRAFAFTLDVEGQYNLDSLEVAAYHCEGMAGSTATFSIRPEVDGLPGDIIIDTFTVSNISTTPQILTVEASEQAELSSGSTYWIVGETSQGQVNWNLADDVFGAYAYRVEDGDWIFDDYGNVSAFAIHGIEVPEPGTVLLLGLGGCGLVFSRKRRQITIKSKR